MIIEIKIPSPGESITEVELVRWLVKDGDLVSINQEIAEVDSDKATLSISADATGKIKFLTSEGERLKVGKVIANIDTSFEVAENTGVLEIKQKAKTPVQHSAITPLAKNILTQNHVKSSDITADKKIHKKEALELLQSTSSQKMSNDRPFEIIRMSSLRRKIAERLVAVKNQTAMLTTFNEVDMTEIIRIRYEAQEIFQKKHGIKLGMMAFFAKACEKAMQEFPAINAAIENENIYLYKYIDLCIAVSTPKGLMTPVVRDVQKKSFAEVEKDIASLAVKARDNKITMEELSGGTFTITNGGVFGSLMSTPILNPPQSAILGMHKIQERPVAINGKIEIRPMMYLALSYDHRIIDGKESVGFIVKVKEILENPIADLFGGKNIEEVLL
jgi:2-oxoglutarate dehydrogenase E2 component (dihydrolipoamide succinyltransferase)